MKQELSDLSVQVEKCTKCPLHRSRNNVVFGEGPDNAPIMMIGEGPGADEDKCGKPFVGKAGQLLDKILAACNFTRTDHVYIANIVKCRPPQNRNPEPLEMQSCLPYLDKQIEIIKPKIVIAMGSVALKGLLGQNMKITRERGNWKFWKEAYLMPVFHPAALLRNPNLKKDTWEDFKKIIKKYKEIVNENHTGYYPH